MVKEAAAHAEEDHRQRELAEARNEADALIYNTERMMKDLGEKVPSDEKIKIENAISNLRSVLSSNDTSQIRSRTEELREASFSLSKLLYQQTAGQAGGQAPGEYAQAGAEAGGPGKEEDVIDAEFKSQ